MSFEIHPMILAEQRSWKEEHETAQVDSNRGENRQSAGGSQQLLPFKWKAWKIRNLPEHIGRDKICSKVACGGDDPSRNGSGLSWTINIFAIIRCLSFPLSPAIQQSSSLTSRSHFLSKCPSSIASSFPAHTSPKRRSTMETYSDESEIRLNQRATKTLQWHETRPIFDTAFPQ